MSALEILSREIKQIQIDIQSDKVTVRSKSLEYLQNIFDNRAIELIRVLSIDNGDDFGISWNQLYGELHKALKEQCSRLEACKSGNSLVTLKNKNDVYKSVLQKCINLANEQLLNVSYRMICSSVFECFGNQSICKYFDVCYLQIVKKHVLGSKHNLGEVKINEWSELLLYMFKLYGKSEISKLNLLECIALIIGHGVKYTDLANDLHQYLPKLIQMVGEEHQYKAQKQLLNTIFAFTTNLAVNQRISICAFTESILDKLIKFYEFNMDADTKLVLFKLFHVAIVIHAPQPHLSNADQQRTISDCAQLCILGTNVADDIQLWHKHLRNMLFVIEREITEQRKHTNRLNSIPKICDIFVRTAARLSAMIFWSDQVWSGGSDEQQQKRRRNSMKLQRVMEMVEYENGKFCWRWLAILSQMLTDYPQLLGVEDYQPLLKLLVDYQPTIQHSIQMQFFTRIVEIMLNKESELKARSTIISESFCLEHWHKIMELALKNSVTSKIPLDNLDLLRVQIDNKVIASYRFIGTIIKDILLNSIKKSNNSISLLISIFRNMNTDLLDGAKELKCSVIKWLHKKIEAFELKKLIEMETNLSIKLIAELSVLCVLSKTDTNRDQLLSSTFGESKLCDFGHYIQNLEQQLQYQMLSKLIVVESARTQAKWTKSPTDQLPDGNSIKVVINETFYAELEKFLSPGDNFNPTSNENEDFSIVSESLAMYVHTLNHFIIYDSLDANKYTKSFLTKRILIKIEQLNSIVERFPARCDENDVKEIVEKLLLIWNENHHPMLTRYIFDQPSNKAIIKWLSAQVKPRQKQRSLIVSPLNAVSQLPLNNWIQFKCLTMLVHFSAYENETDAFTAIQNYEWNFKCNEDLFIVFELIKIMLQQKPTERRAEWAFDCLKLVCQKLTTYQTFIELVAENIPALIKFIKPFSTLYDDITVMLSAFLKQSKKKAYGQTLIAKIINIIPYLAQEFFHDETFFVVFEYMKNFLHFDNLLIQFAAVECLTLIFDKNWLNCDENEIVDCLAVRDFHLKLVEKLHINKLSIEGLDDLDKKNCIFSTRIQMYCSLIGKCFVLRTRTWFNLFELCCINVQLQENKLVFIVETLCQQLFHMTPNAVLDNTIPYLISHWIMNNYLLLKFPWKFTNCETDNDFLIDFADQITLAVLRYQPNLLPDLLKMMTVSSLSAILTKSIIVSCLAYATPLNTASPTITPKYKESGMSLLKILMREKPDCEEYFRRHPLDIVEQLLLNTWDDGKFRQLFETNVEYVRDENTIDFTVFVKTLEFIQKKYITNENIIENSCREHPTSILHVLNAFKLLIQKSTAEEQKLCHLFRICILIDSIADYLTRNAQNEHQSNTIDFFVRDLLHFFGNSISGANCTFKFKLATCNYFLRFCQTILPNCASSFKPFLNYVVSILMPMTKEKMPLKIVDVAMQLLRFLMGQKDSLREAISILDNFPMRSIFEDLRKIHHRIKYNDRTFSLIKEVENFLLIDKRKIEGLVALKEHLSTKKDELQHIYKKIYDSRGFSEDCDKSIIHRLIFALLQTIQGVDIEKSLMAAKCLGELGPSDLGTIVLKSDVQLQTYKVCESFKDAVGNLCECALEKLNALLLHTDAYVLKIVSTACHHLLQSQVGNDLSVKFPYLHAFKSSVKTQMPLKESRKTLILSSLFNDKAYELPHSVWIKNFAIVMFTLFDSEFLAEVAAIQANFAEAMVPLLIKALLTTKNKRNCEELSGAISLFFTKHFNDVDSFTSNGETQEKVPIHMNKSSIKSMLNIAECIRVHNQNSTPTECIKLTYLHIAKAAYYCEAHFTAVLYGELATFEKQTTDNMDTERIRSIMKNAYQSIGEMDAVPAFLDPIKSRTEYLELNQSWNQIYLQQDALVYNRPEGIAAYTKYLSQSGLYSLANKLTHNTDLVDYECAWRLGDWNIFDADVGTLRKTQSIAGTLESKKYHYFALKCLHEKDEMGVKVNVRKAREEIIKTFKQTSYECTQNIYKNLTTLHLLQQIEEFSDIQFNVANETCYTPEFIISKWKHQDAISSSDFIYREPILAQRITIFKSAGIRAKRKIENIFKIDDGIQEMMLNLATECREEGFYNSAIRYLATLNSLKLTREMKAKVFIEDAQLNWCLGDRVLAKHLIHIVANESFPSFCPIKAVGIYGEYLAESRAETTTSIIENYLLRSTKMSSNYKDHGDLAKKTAYHQTREVLEEFDVQNKKCNYQAIAKYADREYQQIAAYKKSTDFEKKQLNIKKNQQILSNMDERNKQKKLTPDERKSFFILTKSIEVDKVDVQSTDIDYATYLQLAIKHYIKCLLLESNESFNSSNIFRIFGLWFANQSDLTIVKRIGQYFKQIASYKFIVVMPQITTHLSNSNDEFSNLIEQIVEKCAIDHPYHVLQQILALSNATKDDESVEDVSPRIDASQKLLQKLKENAALRKIIGQMENMCDVLIRLANISLAQHKEFPANEPIRKLNKLDFIHCPTVKLPISITGDYANKIISIQRWERKFSQPSGINVPKKIECLCSDGRLYSQLLKGKDDLRQDAVMQQVFNIMNDMLHKSKVTRKSRLNIRTYIVVPLSQRSGILEWCKNTMPLTEYLVGASKQQKGAHERYRPTDLTPSQCRQKLSETPRGTPLEKQLKNFKQICERIQPVLHHFFYEKYSNPGIWFERRMAYAHSLATTSMIGYILGIGDRHVSNILIDETTAELIHIDFGIAFEQGKCLPTPELIPFRLTRDMVSALGSTGVEGVFRKSCEKTMDVLRQNKSTIVTIVEVLLHDPLYAWTLTSKKATERQESEANIDDEQDINTMAERALLRLDEKLDGKHVSRSEAASVERHVETLIQEATNVQNLCKLFVGWQAYL